MGTRSITHIYEMDSLREDEIICTFYRQYDGYPDGHGDDLAKWLKGKRLVNGMNSDFIEGIDHNRAGQMAIELMHDLKKDTSIEIQPSGSSDMGEEYTYKIHFNDKGFLISCHCMYGDKKVSLTPDEFCGKDIVKEWSDDED